MLTRVEATWDRQVGAALGILSPAAKARSRPSGLAPSALPLTIVCGPAGSGKSTWVAARARPGDTVIDLDGIADELGKGSFGRVRPAWLLEAALDERNRRLRLLASGSRANGARAFFVVAAPKRADRDWWAQQLGAEHVELMLTPLAECVRRINVDPTRGAGRNKQKLWAAQWWDTYRRETEG